jgi:hypothetical protein
MPAPETRLAAAKRFPKKTPAPDAGKTPAELIDARVRELGDWRGPLLARLRAVIVSADPSVIEEWKWNVPVWSSNGIICTGETYKNAVKLTFARGASLPDPQGIFNASLEGNARRAIDFAESAQVNENALRALILAAIRLNAMKTPRSPKSAA